MSRGTRGWPWKTRSVDRIHDYDEVGPVLDQERWRDDLAADAGHVATLEVRIDIHRVLDRVDVAESGQKAESVGAAAPDHGAESAVPGILKPLAPCGHLAGVPALEV
jgi:hypothetical protein